LLDELRTFFEQHVPGDSLARTREERELQLATTALLLEVTRSDHEVRDEERDAVGRAIQNAIGVSARRSRQMIGLAEQQVRLGTPLHEFARRIDTVYSLEDKKHIVELLWQVAFTDAELTAHEEYVVRKVAELLHVPFQDFFAAKIAARERFFERGGR
jgi:uncharacterized tellurite resistance protein B-like protein